MSTNFGTLEVIEDAPPSSVQARRREDVRGSISGLGDTGPLPRVGTALSDAEVILTEGGPSGLEGLLFGTAEEAYAEDYGLEESFNNGAEIWEEAHAVYGALGELGASTKIKVPPPRSAAVSAARQAAKQITTPRQIDTKASIANLETLAQKRMQAAQLAAKNTAKLTAEVKRLDVEVKAKAAAVVRAPAKAKPIAKAALTKVVAVRAQKAADAVRNAKTQYLGSVLAKNAKTQSNLLKLAVAAQAKGAPQSAQVLAKAAVTIGQQSKRLKIGRQKQIQKWETDQAATKFVAATAAKSMITKQKVAVQQSTAFTPEQKKTRIIALKVKEQAVDQIRDTAEGELRNATIDLFTSKNRNKQLLERQAALRASGLGDLELSWGDVGNALKSAGSAAVGAVKDAGKAVVDATGSAGKAVAGAVEDAAKAAYNAGKGVLMDGACKLANNPQIMNAALGALATAGAAAVGAGAAAPLAAKGGAMAGGAVNDFLKGACPTTTPPAGGPPQIEVPSVSPALGKGGFKAIALRPGMLKVVKASSGGVSGKTIAIGAGAVGAAALLVFLV